MVDVSKLFAGRKEQNISKQDLNKLASAPAPREARVYENPIAEAPTGMPNCLFTAPPTPREFVAWDSETFLITPGNLTPQLVCVQWQHCELGPTGRWKRNPARVMGGSLEDIDAGANFIRALIEESDVVLVTHNGPFDYAVLLKHFGWSKRLFRAICKAYADGRLRDTLVISKLHAIEMGWLEFDPEMGTPAKFDLGSLVLKYTQQHIEGKHGPDVWRMNYHKLYGIPSDQWPVDAFNYALYDPCYTADLFIALLNTITPSPDEVFQERKAWFLHLGSVQGLSTDQAKVKELEDKILPKIEEGIGLLTEIGIYRSPTYHVDKDKIADLVVKALGDSTQRTGKGDVSLTDKQLKNAAIRLDMTEKQILKQYGDIAWLRANHPDFVLEKAGTKNMALLYQAVSEHFEGSPPTTDSGRVSTARKVLKEIPKLKPLVDIGEAQKVKTTYLPVLKRPIVNSRVNSLVATGRPSYSGPNIANQPRMEGVRECWVAPMDLIVLTEDE